MYGELPYIHEFIRLDRIQSMSEVRTDGRAGERTSARPRTHTSIYGKQSFADVKKSAST